MSFENRRNIDDTGVAKSMTRNSSTLSEQTPLLREDARTTLPDAPEDHHQNLAFPTIQVLLLSASRLVESIVFFAIVPFISEMVGQTGVPESDLGFYVGLIVSSQARSLKQEFLNT